MKLILSTKKVEGDKFLFHMDNGTWRGKAGEYESKGELELYKDEHTGETYIMLRTAAFTDKALEWAKYQAPMLDAHLLNGAEFAFLAAKQLLFGRSASSRYSEKQAAKRMNQRYEEARQRVHGDEQLDYENIKKTLQCIRVYKGRTEISVIDKKTGLSRYYIQVINWSAPEGYYWCLGALSAKEAKKWSEALNVPITSE